jgi:predicted small secreted protein
MNTHIRKLALLLMVGSFAMTLGACRTMKGLGEDTEVAGEKIQKEADRHIDDKNKKDEKSSRS